MKRIVLKTYGKIIGFLFTVAGMNITCAMYGTPAVEYGVPSADYIVKGKVINKATLKPIKDIRVIQKATWKGVNDTVMTDENGNYALNIGFDSDKAVIYAADLDGMLNDGLFETDSLVVWVSEMKQVKKGDGNWYLGIFEKQDANFSLKYQNVAEYGVIATTFKKISEDK